MKAPLVEANARASQDRDGDTTVVGVNKCTQAEASPADRRRRRDHGRRSRRRADQIAPACRMESRAAIKPPCKSPLRPARGGARRHQHHDPLDQRAQAQGRPPANGPT